MFRAIASVLILMTLTSLAQAQTVTVATVTRAPFSMVEDGVDTGFSLELWAAVAKELGLKTEVRRFEGFGDMLQAVERGEADLAVANISITAAREEVMDFSHPIYASGLQIMVPEKAQSASLISALFSPQMLFAIAGAFALLFGGGMLMWWFERRAQPYFDKPASEAMFPSFWWALNLVVNGGFEERVPRTFFGRVFGTLLVVSSLFVVSVFVANITASMTVDAIQGTINAPKDLYGKRVGTISGSTASLYLDGREIDARDFTNLPDLLDAFESGDLDAVVFDAPILAYYTTTRGAGKATMVGAVFLNENYGFALPSGSDLLERVNRALLTLKETGVSEALSRKYFGKG